MLEPILDLELALARASGPCARSSTGIFYVMRVGYEQLEALETELTESGTIYRCPPGQHDDLGISCAMLAWAARHPHFGTWVGPIVAARRPRPKAGQSEKSRSAWKAYT